MSQQVSSIATTRGYQSRVRTIRVRDCGLARTGNSVDLFKPFPLATKNQKIGSCVDNSGRLIGFALTPGYETYEGLGRFGAIVQARRS